MHAAICPGNCTTYLRRHARKRHILRPYNSRWTSTGYSILLPFFCLVRGVLLPGSRTIGERHQVISDTLSLARLSNLPSAQSFSNELSRELKEFTWRVQGELKIRGCGITKRSSFSSASFQFRRRRCAALPVLLRAGHHVSSIHCRLSDCALSSLPVCNRDFDLHSSPVAAR